MVVKLKDLTLRFSKLLRIKHRGKSGRTPRARRRWRVEIINENTLTRTWSWRLSEMKAWAAGAVLLAGGASLVAMIVIFTPLGAILRGDLPRDLRGQYRDMALRVDSVSRLARINEAYTRNIVGILTDSLPDDYEQAEQQAIAAEGSPTADSLMTASDAEKQFVQQFEARERFNLSVLSPIAAEGMIFETPTASDDGIGAVAAIYRGTVVALSYDKDGLATVTVQHPNDFISSYANLKEAYVKKGEKIVAGQRIGKSTTEAPLLFELWHAGSKLDAAQYIIYPVKE